MKIRVTALLVALVVFAVAVPVGTAAQGEADVAGSENRVGTVVDPGDSSGNTSTAGQRAGETGVPDPSNEGQSGALHSVTHPLDPTPTLEQPDGTTFEARFWSAGPTGGWRTVDGHTVLRGADGYWYYATRGEGRLVPGGARVGIDRVPASVPTGLAPSVGTDSAAVGTDEVPPTGTQEIPVVAINFSDTTKSYAPSEFQSLLFGDDPDIATGPGSVTDYYEENSGGQLTLTGDVSGWETADNGESYYGDGGIGDGGSPTGAAELVKEAAQKADDQVDFAQYDNDDDCLVDQFATIHQGGGQEVTRQTEDIWSHRWSLASGTGSAYATDDSSPGCSTIYVNGYTIQPETYGGQIATIGVYAHEFGHGLGLPDLYDTDGSSAGIGEWGLMGSGSYGSVVRSGDAPNHMTAWTKAYLGWLDPPTVATGESQDGVSLANVSKNNEYLRLLDGSNNPNGEYFYVANRQQVGFDQGVPGEGLLVTHINESRLADDCIFSNSCNDDEKNKLVDIEAADGNGDLNDNTNRGDAGDPWDEGTGPFDGGSTPSSDYDDGSSSNAAVSAIGFSAGTSQGTATLDASVPVEMFDVTITSVDSTVTEGETITVAYEVTNTGDVADTQDIGFAVNGTTESTEAGVTLNGSETFSDQFTYDTGTGDAPAVSVAVSSQDDSASATVTVNEPSSFDVTITSVDSAVAEGETITVVYEVQNTGDVMDTQDIGFAVNGTTEDTEAGVTLNGSETFSGQFSYATSGGDTPAVSVAVSSADDSSSSTVTVNEPASFDVTLTSVDSAVTEDETVTLAYEVTNTGDTQDTQDITFAVNGTTEDSELGVTLSGNETFSGQFTYDTVAGDAPVVSVAVSSADDSDSNTVTVNEPSSFVVEIVETNTPVEGESLNVTVTVENTGDVQDTQSIDLSVGPLGSDSTAVTLAGGASTNVTFSVSTGAGDAGGYTATVSSADDSASANVTVLAPAELLVGIVETNTPVEGEQLNVTTIIENTGDVQDTQTVTLDVGPPGSNSTAVTLGGGASTNVTLSVGTGAGDAGEYTAMVASADDAASANVTVLAPAEFVVSIVETTTPVEGEQLTVTATIENTGDVQDTQSIELSVGALGTDSTTVTLGGGASTNVTLSVGTDAGDAGAYTATVSSAADSASANVTVLALAEFTVNIVETTSPVEGESLSVTANIQNSGDLEDTQEINLSVGTLGTDSTTVTLGGGASTDVTLSVGTGAGDAGAYTVTVASEDDTTSANVTVNEPSSFDVTIPSVDAAVTEGETITVAYEVTNIGDVAATQDIGFAVNGTTEDTASSVTLNGSETVSGQFTYATAGGDAPAVSVAVSSADNAATETVTVTEPASFDMTITNVDAAVTEGEMITVAYEVTNTGDVQGTQGITFAVNGTTEDTASSVMLNGSETVSGQFTYDTVAGDAPAVSVTVSSADDSASATVTVNEPPSFDMTITSVDSAVTEGETITVAYEVTNTGDVADTQDITFAVNGTAEDTASGVMLNGSETFNRQFTYDTVTGDAPVVSVTVSSANDTATATVTVTEPANFDVNITSVDSEVTQGETITVGYEVTNTGDVAGTQDITFAVNGTPESVESGVTLNGSETVSDQFSYDTVAGDAPAVTVTVSSEDNTASANVTVLAPAVFTVDIVETTTPVEGETLNVTADIENTGAVEGTQTVTLDVGTLGTDSTSVTLDGGGSTTLTLGVGTDTGDAGAYTATVSSANATTSANVTVLTPAQFVVSTLTAPAETTVGASITVSATVTNIGETDGLQAVAFRFDGQTVANRTVSLTPNASTTLTFTPTVPNQTGTFEHGVFTDDDNQTAEITVVDPEPPTVALSNLRIAGHGDNATVLAGSYNVSVTVSHDGGPGGVVPVELTVGPTTVTENITLNASETTTVTFENATGDLSPGSYDVTVSAVNASVTGEVTLSVIVGDNPNPATDTDDDGLLEDVDGDGEFTIFDVQTFFIELQSDPVQTNSALFNFDEDEDGAVTIFDVQALFTDLS